MNREAKMLRALSGALAKQAVSLPLGEANTVLICFATAAREAAEKLEADWREANARLTGGDEAQERCK